MPYAESSPNVFMVEDRGAVSEARNARRVLVPRETFASNVSAPPKTFRTLAEAL